MFPSPVPEDLVLRVFSLQGVDIGAAIALVNIHAYRTVQVAPRSLAVYATPEQMSRIQKLVAGLEVPLPGATQQPPSWRQWRIIVFLLGAGEGAPGQSVPAVLQPVVRELEQALPYRGYTLRDALPVLVTPGTDTSVKSLLSTGAFGEDGEPGGEPYSIEFRKILPLTDAAGVIGEVSFGTQVRVRQGGPSPEKFFTQQVGLRSQASLSPGESVVLGRVGITDSSSNLFVILHMPKQ
jgi:hypothetical protein